MDNEKRTYRVIFAYELYSDPASEFCIFRYKNTEDTPDVPKGKEFTAKGKGLSKDKSRVISLTGRWTTDIKRGRVFNVEYQEIELPTDKNGVIEYLKGMKIRIGARAAQDIYKTFGEDTWQILEENPEAFLRIRGISPDVVQKLREKAAETNMVHRITERYSECSEMTASKAAKIFALYKADALKTLETDPYILYEELGFNFRTVEAIARSQPGWVPTSESRLLTGVQVVFDDASREGHTCIPKKDAIARLIKRLDISEKEARLALNFAYQRKKCIVSGDLCYSVGNYLVEKDIAADVVRLLREKPCFPLDDKELERLISEFERTNHIQLAEQQKAAVAVCFKSNIAIITGGPGTGKSTIIKAVMFVARKSIKNCNITLLAPTGRAAKRMRETTQSYASTIHAGLGIRFGDDGETAEMQDTEPLDTEMIIVDETSMMDQYITRDLLSRVGKKTSLIFVGDADQLPSVAAGNVLSELIKSEKVPFVRLNVIFRQAGDNPIITNSKKILTGDTNIEQSKSFRLYNTDDNAKCFDFACNMYRKCVNAYGIDNVVLLVPYRQTGEICSDTLNKELQATLNPPKSGEAVMKCGKRTYRVGDKVMQRKNTDKAKNGDIGFIKKIERRQPEGGGGYDWFCEIQFEDEVNTVWYGATQMANIDLAYAQSIHKSQGSEFKTVLMVVTNEHANMARRNLIYTGVTRAKQNFAFIGQREALVNAILNEKVEIRYTRLAELVNLIDEKVPQGSDTRLFEE